jgi:hypothetical protein
VTVHSLREDAYLRVSVTVHSLREDAYMWADLVAVRSLSEHARVGLHPDPSGASLPVGLPDAPARFRPQRGLWPA